ncbi:hypothetical protein M3Y96_00455500 [Aphelenchoides besseyi]|nr:hypothetical protein M3Y96_00455500 [Aphelenchoides besseyi]
MMLKMIPSRVVKPPNEAEKERARKEKEEEAAKLAAEKAQAEMEEAAKLAAAEEKKMQADAERERKEKKPRSWRNWKLKRNAMKRLRPLLHLLQKRNPNLRAKERSNYRMALSTSHVILGTTYEHFRTTTIKILSVISPVNKS